MFPWSSFQTSSFEQQLVGHPGHTDKDKKQSLLSTLRCHSLREVDLTIQDATFLSSPATTTLSSSLCFAVVKRDESTEDMGRYEVEVGTIVFPAPLCSLSIRSSLKESRELTWVCMLRRCWRSSGFSKSITELESENIYCIYCLTTKGIPDIDLPNLGQQLVNKYSVFLYLQLKWT